MPSNRKKRKARQRADAHRKHTTKPQPVSGPTMVSLSARWTLRRVKSEDGKTAPLVATERNSL